MFAFLGRQRCAVKTISSLFAGGSGLYASYSAVAFDWKNRTPNQFTNDEWKLFCDTMENTEEDFTKNDL